MSLVEGPRPRSRQEWLQCIRMGFRFKWFLFFIDENGRIGINSRKNKMFRFELTKQWQNWIDIFFNRNLQHLLNKWTCEAFFAVPEYPCNWQRLTKNQPFWVQTKINMIRWSDGLNEAFHLYKNLLNPPKQTQKSINNLSWMDTFRLHKLSTSMDAENTMKVYQNAWEAQICKHAHSIWENANLDHTKFQPHHRVPGLILTWTWLHIHNFQALWNGDTRVSIGHVFYPPWTPSKTGGNSHCSAGPAWGDKTHNKKHRDIRYTKRVGTVDDQVFASLITLGDVVVDDNDDDDDGDDGTCLLIAIIWAWEISSASPLPGRKGC